MKNKKIAKFVSAMVLTLTLVCLAAPVALAQKAVTTEKVKDLTVEDVAKSIISWVLGIITLVAVIMIIYAGIMWITSAGDDTKLKSAKAMLMAAIIGLIIAVIAYAVTNTVLTGMGLSV